MKRIVRGFTAGMILSTLLVSVLTGCGQSQSLQSASGSSVSGTTAIETDMRSYEGNPENIEKYKINDMDSADKEEAQFVFQGKKYQLKEDELCWREEEEEKRISLIEKEEDDQIKYSLGDFFLIDCFLFYSDTEFTEKLFEDGAEYNWGKSVLWRFNLETGVRDYCYVMTEDSDKTRVSLSGVDLENEHLYLTVDHKVKVLDFSLNEAAEQEVGKSGIIENIYWAEEGFVFSDEGIFKMNLIPVNHNMKEPEKLCDWPDTIRDHNYYIRPTGSYGKFLYGYAYYHGNSGSGIGGYYFQVDIEGKKCNVLSADTEKSFFGDYDAETNFNTDSFEKKHELYSEGREPKTWEPILVKYRISEDGTVKIETDLE